MIAAASRFGFFGLDSFLGLVFSFGADFLGWTFCSAGNAIGRPNCTQPESPQPTFGWITQFVSAQPSGCWPIEPQDTFSHILDRHADSLTQTDPQDTSDLQPGVPERQEVVPHEVLQRHPSWQLQDEQEDFLQRQPAFEPHSVWQTGF